MFVIPANEINITKELLLKNHSEEEFMEFYLGIPVRKGLQISPLRTDKKPTASFFRNKKGDLIFHDFDGSFYGNFISVVMQLFQCSYYKALKIIAIDFGIIKTEVHEPHLPKLKYTGSKIEEKQTTSNIQVKLKEFSKKEIDWWKSFGISITTLKKFQVYSCEHSFLNGYYYSSSSDTSPVYGYFGGLKDGIDLWRLYMPTKRTYRFLSNWTSKMLQGSKQLPTTANFLIITKSLKDVMSLYELNICSIAPCSESVLISEYQIDRLKAKYNKLILFVDNDLAGVKSAKKYKKTYPFLKCIFLKRKYAKDISDLYKKRGISHFLECEEEILVINSNDDLRFTKHFYVF